MRDLLAKHEPDTIRALLLSSQYRRPIDYSNDRLDEIARGLQGFRNLFERFERIAGASFYTLPAPEHRDDEAVAGAPPDALEHRRRFLEAMDDDFNTGGALGELHEIARVLNRFADAERLESEPRDPAKLESFRRGVVVLRELTNVLGLFRKPPALATSAQEGLTGPLLDLLVELRTRLRKEKNFALADEIRNRLGGLGVALEDRPDGTGWKVEGPSR
jgi:cysteinyl-tRNA synthetase